MDWTQCCKLNGVRKNGAIDEEGKFRGLMISVLNIWTSEFACFTAFTLFYCLWGARSTLGCTNNMVLLPFYLTQPTMVTHNNAFSHVSSTKSEKIKEKETMISSVSVVLPWEPKESIFHKKVFVFKPPMPCLKSTLL